MLCPLFFLWFASGFVMMYWGFPEVGQDERLGKAEALTPSMIRVSPEAAYALLQWPNPPDDAGLSMLGGRPIYQFRTRRLQSIVYADTGDRLASVSQGMALGVAARWTGQSATEAHFDDFLRDADQWTVSGHFAALRPLFKFSWPNGEQVYVSASSGEVVQHTKPHTRLAAYFGAIPHWSYWTLLKKNNNRWYKFVVWSSGIATSVSLLGLIVGCWMYSPSRRYRFRGHPTRIPYSGPKRWHMFLGLLFGSLACTWAFSGLLSMEPFDWLAGNDEYALKVAAAMRGAIRLDAFASKGPGVALDQASLQTKELEFVFFDGEPFYVARQSVKVARIVPVRGNPSDQFDPARILELVRRTTTSVAEANIISRYDAYYLDRNGQHPLPALLVRLNDASRSQYYIDLKTARIVEAYDSRLRWNRWLYHGLHSWNLPWLYSHRPAWDILVIALLLGGTALTATALTLGIRVLGRLLK